MALCRAITPRLGTRSEEHTSELQSRLHLVCRLLLEKKKTTIYVSLPAIAAFTAALISSSSTCARLYFSRASASSYAFCAQIGIVPAVMFYSDTLLC